MPKVAELTPYRDLSDGMVRSLALIAALQPVKQSVLVKLQGNKVYDYVKRLEEKKLIKSRKAGRTKILETTKHFEAYFGSSIEEIRAKLREVLQQMQATEVAIQKHREVS